MSMAGFSRAYISCADALVSPRACVTQAQRGDIRGCGAPSTADLGSGGSRLRPGAGDRDPDVERGADPELGVEGQRAAVAVDHDGARDRQALAGAAADLL